ncbi:MAG: mechanosensitive ion channel family protein [Methanotrichaceae archaeon]|nr:mechanosensitive ion channel family protein [Methanotrichaceae archaeon]
MARRWLTLGLLLFAGSFILLANRWLGEITLTRGAATVFALAAIYFVFKIIVQDRIITRIELPDRRYYLSKVAFTGYIFAIVAAIAAIWVENIQALLFGFGLVAAAFTITMQDVARNFAGGSIIYVNGIYKVGDRIEIGSKKGDVIDIGILYTTLMETNEWVSGDQHTGRLSVLPNSYVLGGTLNNYTRDFNFLWDEITVPITYESDWRQARSLILNIIRRETATAKDVAEQEIATMEKKYLLSKRSLEADIFMRLTDNWIELTARYVIPARQRRITRSRISQMILEEIEASEGIKIASATFDIVGFPEISIKDGLSKREEE